MKKKRTKPLEHSKGRPKSEIYSSIRAYIKKQKDNKYMT